VVTAQSGRKTVAKKVSIAFPEAPVSGPPAIVTGPWVPVSVAITDDTVTAVKILVATKTGDAHTVYLTRKQTQIAQPIFPFKGINTMTLFAVRGDVADTKPSDEIHVQCSPPTCGMTPGALTGGMPSGSSTPAMTIKQPAGDTTEGTVTTLISVANPSEIKNLSIAVYDKDENRVDFKPSVKVILDEDRGLAIATLKLASGQNTIRVFDPDKRTDTSHQAIAVVTCTGDKCGKGQSTETAEDGKKEAEVTILTPAANTAANEGTFDAVLSVAKGSKIGDKLEYDVIYTADHKTKRDVGDVVDVPAHSDKAAVVIVKKIHVRSGQNTIRFFDPDRPGAAEAQASVNVTCGDGKCFTGSTEDANKLSVAVSARKDDKGTYLVENVSSLDALVTVPKGDTTKIRYDVYGPDNKEHHEEIAVEGAAEKAVEVPVRLKFFAGVNTIRIFDPAVGKSETQAILVIKCTGENCATDLEIATIPTNSQNTRVGVGLEQVGGSSAESKTKPFLDFFFTTPFWYDKPKTELIRTLRLDANGAIVRDAAGNPIVVYVKRTPEETGPRVPRMGLWGQIRLTATPEQLTATGVLPSTLANRVAQTGTTANLVQSFDFLAGLQGRLFTGNGSFLSLIPGIRQKTRFYLAGGYGAISPLDATKENTQFYLIPQAASSQRALFEERYGTPPASATHIALVPLDRDRFYRQWYAGLRLQTFFCDGEDEHCSRFRNSFPAITDFMIGQSESVTGGSFKRTNANGKTKQAFVFKIEAFYPLPIREARFIYLYGTAIMKIGGDVRVNSPLLLDPATSIPNINDPLVYIPPVDLLRAQQPNRDYYKIGVGINLTDFFNRNKPR